jgi:hypothetical protein
MGAWKPLKMADDAIVPALSVHIVAMQYNKICELNYDKFDKLS